MEDVKVHRKTIGFCLFALLAGNLTFLSGAYLYNQLLLTNPFLFHQLTAAVTVSKTLSVDSSSSAEKPAIEAPAAATTPTAAKPDATAPTTNGTTPNGATPKDATPKDATPKDATSKDATPGSATPATPGGPVTAKSSDALDNVDEESDSDDEDGMTKEEMARYQQQKKEQVS